MALNDDSNRTPSESESDLAESSEARICGRGETPQTLEQEIVGQKTRTPRRLVLGSREREKERKRERKRKRKRERQRERRREKEREKERAFW